MSEIKKLNMTTVERLEKIFDDEETEFPAEMPPSCKTIVDARKKGQELEVC